MPNGDATFLEGDFERASQAMANLANELVEEFGLGPLLEEASTGREALLTSGAWLTLIIPLIEAADMQAARASRAGLKKRDEELDVDADRVRATITSLLESLGETPAAADRLAFGPEAGAARSSLSMLRAIQARWCRIPPICGT